MFVVVEAWKNLDAHELEKSLPERVGLAMKHAGVSVTVTSITDIVAFGIGASTVSIHLFLLISVCPSIYLIK